MNSNIKLYSKHGISEKATKYYNIHTPIKGSSSDYSQIIDLQTLRLDWNKYMKNHLQIPIIM